MFGRPREHHRLGTDAHAKVTTVVAWVLGALVVVLLATLVVAALVG